MKRFSILCAIVSWALVCSATPALAATPLGTSVETVTVPATVSTPAPQPAPAQDILPAGRWVGFYVAGAPWSMAPLAALESKVGTRAAVVNFYLPDSARFPTTVAQSVATRGAIPMITLEFWSTKNGGLSRITDGSRDAKIAAFADAAKAWGGNLLLRPFHEMNGNWYPWGGSRAGNSAKRFVAAWRHVRNIFRNRGATNVKFVWCVNNESVPNTSANRISKYWPGMDYVDYMAIDGYNFGRTASWSHWKPFAKVIGPAYASVTALTKAKPLFLAETSSVEQGGSKSAWIADMFKKITTTYPRIRGVCWFDEKQAQDWRLTSSTKSLSGFKKAIAKGF